VSITLETASSSSYPQAIAVDFSALSDANVPAGIGVNDASVYRTDVGTLVKRTK